QQVALQIDGAGATDPAFLRIAEAASRLQGTQLNHAAYETIRNDLLRTAATYGYVDARLTTAELRVDPPAFSATATLEFSTGPRYRFGATRIEQNAIDEPLLRRYLRYRQDEPFDATDLLRTQFALDDSQYFANVEVATEPPDRDNLLVPIAIKAEANRRNRYSFGVGYGTDSGVRGTASWDNRRVNVRGHRFRIEGKAAQQQQSIETRYQIPIGDPAIEKLSVQLNGRSEKDVGDLELRTLEIEPSVTQLRGRWQRVSGISFGRTTTITRLPDLPDRRDIDSLIIPSVSFVAVPQGYLGEALYLRGTYLELRGSTPALGAPASYLQGRVELERVFDLAPRWHLLLRGQIGASLVDSAQDLPGTERFFTGGDRSVRGFSYNDLSPVREVPELDAQGRPRLDADGRPIVTRVKVGGKHFVAATVELEYDLPRNLGIAAFVDSGNAFDKFGDPLAVAVGIGIRWRLPVVTLGIDIAKAIDAPRAPGESLPGARLHLNFAPKF
ncbi:MAG: BamA/TamA family outer membrane protein, partial [Steroidobacteraceae bacterium]|nr:BamA/TamA family outer membrane protein [Steroidobacteraceae bacterium]